MKAAFVSIYQLVIKSSIEKIVIIFLSFTFFILLAHSIVLLNTETDTL